MHYRFKIIYIAIMFVIINSCELMKKYRLNPENEKHIVADKDYRLHVKANLFFLYGFWIETKVIIDNSSVSDTIKWHPELFKLSIHRKENDSYNIFNKIDKNPGNILLPGRKEEYVILSSFEDINLIDNPKLLKETKYIIELDTIFCGETKVLPEPITFKAK